jgi:diaminohydroxyphosphoribosylaminopyrimidine deaminase/5-amino-6-(5-phosphoribosylamino)uracil reductase
MTTNPTDLDRKMLERAARVALRGHGDAEPNPSVGCVIADATGRVVAEGRTAICGGPHAEVVALRRAGDSARGGTAWVTLEPCNHHGRTPPCVVAIIAAGVGRVVVGVRDPNPVAAGGLDRLRAAGIEVVVRADVTAARRVHANFLGRIATGRPWLVAKWAETADGDLIAPSDHPRTISSPVSHRMVHRERGRVDAILTGIGTVTADDPRLDVRTRHARRTPRRVVVDRTLSLSPDATLFRTPGGDVTVAADADVLEAKPGRTAELAAAGATFIPLPTEDHAASRRRSSPDALHHLLHTLAREHGVATVLTEAGPGLLRDLFDANLVDAALVFTAPWSFDVRTTTAPPRNRLDRDRFEPLWTGHRGGDRVTWWQRV